ncbi:imidazolonepropionase-like domain-containing protein [Streptomyces sp. NPDC052396]|uniref:imidazolonepropionase-like domain-containing protein n=1 Tax=Streptomyces sp. NPDC052396 TaxID=3365689 RepID=UPI0037D6B0D3
MLTVHAADLLLAGDGSASVPGGAVAVDGGRVTALGPLPEVSAAHPTARVRRWPGLLLPGLRQWHGAALLERTYHPDPREYGTVGDRPLTGDRLAALEMSETRWAGSARRGLQRMLGHGTVAVAGPFRDPVVRTAVARSGLTVLPVSAPPPGEADLDPLRGAAALADVLAAPLAVGARADLAVFDAPDEAGLLAAGAGTCVATVLGGRLVHRRA